MAPVLGTHTHSESPDEVDTEKGGNSSDQEKSSNRSLQRLNADRSHNANHKNRENGLHEGASSDNISDNIASRDALTSSNDDDTANDEIEISQEAATSPILQLEVSENKDEKEDHQENGLQHITDKYHGQGQESDLVKEEDRPVNNAMQTDSCQDENVNPSSDVDKAKPSHLRNTEEERNQKKDPDKDGKDNENDEKSKDDDNGVPIDRGWAWMVALGCFFLFLIHIVQDRVMAVLFLDILDHFDTKVSVMTIIMSLASICYCVGTQTSTNILVVKFSIRSVITCAGVINAAATLLFVAPPTLPTLFIYNFVKAAAKGVTLVSTLTLVGFYFRRRRALATSLGLLGISISGVVAPPLVRYMRDEYGFRGCFLMLAGIEANAIAAGLLLRPLSSYKQKKDNRDTSSTKTEEQHPLISDKDKDDEMLNQINMSEIIEQLPVSESSITEISITEITGYTESETSPLSDQETRPDLEAIAETEEETRATSVCDSRNSNKLNGSVASVHSHSNRSLGIRNETNELSPDNSQSTNSPQRAQHGSQNCVSWKCGQAWSKEATTVATLCHNDKDGSVHLSPQSALEQADKGPIRRQTSTEAPVIEYSVSRPLDTKSNWSLVSASMYGSTLNFDPIIATEMDTDDASKSDKSSCQCCCQWFRKIVDLKLFKNYLCELLIWIYVFTVSGGISGLYLPSYAIKVGVSPQNAALMVTVAGCMDMVGRVFFGYFADLKLVRPNQIIAVANLALGIVSHFSDYYQGFGALMFFSVMQGLLGCAGQNLCTALIVDVMGLEYLAKVLSMSSLCLSLSFILQHPIHGALIESTGNFLATFHYCGTSYLLAASLLLSEPLIRRLQTAKDIRKEQESKKDDAKLA